MNIVTDNAEYELNSRDEIKALLHQSATKPFDDIWVYGKEEYPCLAVLINGNRACIHYFLEADGKMWQSIGYGNCDVVFKSNGEEIEMPANAVVSLDKAMECVMHFADSEDRPECIEWREL